MTIDITKIIVAIIGLLGAIITTFIIPWIKSKTTAEQQSLIRSIATIAVYAAQQLFTNSDEKKEYALNYVRETLKNYNIVLTENEISTYIEAVLKDIKTSLDDNSKW